MVSDWLYHDTRVFHCTWAYDPYLQVIAIYVVGITVMEVVVAFADYQLSFYRNVITLGLFAGLLVKLPMLDEEQKGNSTSEYTDGVSVLS